MVVTGKRLADGDIRLPDVPHFASEPGGCRRDARPDGGPESALCPRIGTGSARDTGIAAACQERRSLASGEPSAAHRPGLLPVRGAVEGAQSGRAVCVYQADRLPSANVGAAL